MDEVSRHRSRGERKQSWHDVLHDRSGTSSAAHPAHRDLQHQMVAMRTQKFLAAACLGAAVLAGVACRDVTSLQQSNPGALDASTVYIPANAVLLTNGVIADFECAFSRYVVGSGVFTDELSDAIANPTNYEYDRRAVLSNSSYGTGSCGSNQQAPIYTTLSTARGSGDTVAAKLRLWTDAELPAGVSRVKLIAQASAY